MIPQAELKAEQVRSIVLDQLEKHLSWKTEGDQSRTQMTFDILVKAALEQSSVEAVCADLHGVIDSNTLGEQLYQALDVRQLRQHEAEMNQALGLNCLRSCHAAGCSWRWTGTMNPSMAKRRSC